jgi:hypothetical protein
LFIVVGSVFIAVHRRALRVRHIHRLVAVAGVLIVLAPVMPARGAIMAGQVDTFEDGSLQAWFNGGATNPNPVVNVATGGPAGTNDNFLSLRSDGAGPGGKLVMFNASQWGGNYLDAGVGSIRMQVNNVGATSLTLRLILTGTGQSLGTVADVNVPSGSGWTTVSFSLAPGNLSGGTFASVMGNVTELNVVHSPTLIVARSGAPNITAQIGLDNITAVAVPEPSAFGLALIGFAATAMRRGVRGGAAATAANNPTQP